MKVKAARLLVALYAFCVIMPVAGFAFGDSAMAAHCLTGMSPGVVQLQRPAHQQGDAQAHQDHAHHDMDHQTAAMSGDDAPRIDHAGMKGHAGTPDCCGVMCVSALPASMFELTPRTMIHASVVVSSDAGISGEAPDLPYRPPIVPLSI